MLLVGGVPLGVDTPGDTHFVDGQALQNPAGHSPGDGAPAFSTG